MGQFSTFDELPVVVHDGILRSLASPREVANLIRASPGSLQAYMTGGRKSFLLAAMRNFLSLENQHLMNLVMAAPRYSQIGQVTLEIPEASGFENASACTNCNSVPRECYDLSATETNVELDGVASRDDFRSAVRCFLEKLDPRVRCSKHEIRRLSLNTLDSSTRLFAVMDRTIRTYCMFTVARAQLRFNKLSGPQTFMSLSTVCDQPAADDREIQRVWRGFLLHELFCIMWGMPQISADAAGRWNAVDERELDFIVQSFRGLPTHVLEEFLCARQYVHEQYDLAVNEVKETFRLAVTKISRHLPVTGCSTPLELDMSQRSSWQLGSFWGLPAPVRYLVKHRTSIGLGCRNIWAAIMVLLGIRFLEDFLSQDATARLDFIRATFPYLSQSLIRPHNPLFASQVNLLDLTEKHLALSRAQNDISNNRTSVQARLRAVGWIFWDSPDRLASINLVPGLSYASYISMDTSRIPWNLQHDDGYFVLETPTDPEDRERIVRDFGTLTTQDQHHHIERLFRAAGSLKFSDVTMVVNGSRDRNTGDTSIEAKDGDGRLGQDLGREGSRLRPHLCKNFCGRIC